MVTWLGLMVSNTSTMLATMVLIVINKWLLQCNINEGEGEGEGGGETGGGCDNENNCCIGGWCDNKIMMLIKMMREMII